MLFFFSSLWIAGVLLCQYATRPVSWWVKASMFLYFRPSSYFIRNIVKSTGILTKKWVLLFGIKQIISALSSSPWIKESEADCFFLSQKIRGHRLSAQHEITRGLSEKGQDFFLEIMVKPCQMWYWRKLYFLNTVLPFHEVIRIFDMKTWQFMEREKIRSSVCRFHVNIFLRFIKICMSLGC